jgi:glutathione S-transferase
MLIKYLRRYSGLTTDEVLVAKHTETLNAKLDVYEKILSKQKYLAGNVS